MYCSDLVFFVFFHPVSFECGYLPCATPSRPIPSGESMISFISSLELRSLGSRKLECAVWDLVTFGVKIGREDRALGTLWHEN